MTAISDYLEAKIINWALRAAAMGTAPANVYIALHTADPGDTGASEVTGNAYARVAVSTTGGWSDPGATSGATENAAAITFPQATPAGWGTVTHVSVWDAATAGNMLFRGALAASKTVAANDRVEFAAGALDISVA